MIAVLGINHKTAPVEIREQFSLNDQQILGLSEKILQDSQFYEITVLSTCNRFEVYYYTGKTCDRSHTKIVLQNVFEYLKIDPATAQYFYFYSKTDAVKHLMKVSAGLDSMVLGENQILGQVKEAYRLSSASKLTGTILNRLFHKSFESGKRVRTETAINQGATSLSYAAVELAGKIFSNIQNKSVLLVGAGETAELVLQSLYERGVRNMVVTNRTFERAEKVARKYHGRAVEYGNLPDYLGKSDVIISAVTVAEPLITRKSVKEILKIRKNPTVFFVDLSVPRSINDDLKDYESVFLYDVDDLNEVVKHNYEKRKDEIARAEEIVQLCVQEFEQWFSSLEVVPVIKHLKDVCAGLKESELAPLKSKLSDAEFSAVNSAVNSLVNKFQGTIIKNLKELTSENNGSDVLDTITKIFKTKK